jgi:hypothetical protein
MIVDTRNFDIHITEFNLGRTLLIEVWDKIKKEFVKEFELNKF